MSDVQDTTAHEAPKARPAFADLIHFDDQKTGQGEPGESVLGDPKRAAAIAGGVLLSLLFVRKLFRRCR